jgi:large subunit ribosomal protein L1
MDRCLASMARLSLTQTARQAQQTIPRFLAPSLVHGQHQQTRHASGLRIKKKAKKTRVIPKDFRRHRLEKYEFPRFSLVEAMRYVLVSHVPAPVTTEESSLSNLDAMLKNSPRL